jgi:transcriptional regulator with XRE-family HTH domain
MTSTDRILDAFIEAWQAGKRPDLDEYLEQAAAGERDELAGQIAAWLEIAPTPDYDEKARAEIAAEPALQAAFARGDLRRQPFAARFRTLRERAGVGVRDLAERIVDSFGLAGDEGKAESYLERLQDGDLDSSRLSRRLLDTLARALGADRDLLAPDPPRRAAGAALFRADSSSMPEVKQDIDALSRLATSKAPPSLDEVDRLFLGGPDA